MHPLSKSSLAKKQTLKRSRQNSPSAIRGPKWALSTREQVRRHWTVFENGSLTPSPGILGSKNPFGKKAKSKEHKVWLLDNTAYQPIPKGDKGTPQPWTAEFVACYFRSGRKDVTKYVSSIADILGIDGKAGQDPEAQKRIEERLRPFVMGIAPARTVDIQIPCPTPGSNPHKRLLGPSNQNGISSQLLLTGGSDDVDGTTVECTSDEFPDLKGTTRFVGPEGWAIISDIDDTIKVTMTSTPTGILQSTFADIPQTTPGMTEFYKVLEESLGSPAWFYLSASPYNLYPFLHEFINKNYPQGTIILRDASWMYFGGLLQSFTEGVKDYKTSRIEKVHSWLPQRKFICIGDSTQSDPEAYAQMYTKYPDWIKAIYIRKVTNAPHMQTKNKNQRFIEAFKDVPDHIWRVFVDPKEVADHLKHVSGLAHSGMIGNLLGR